MIPQSRSPTGAYRQLQEVKEHIKRFLAQRVIVESHSPYAIPVVLARKKDGNLPSVLTTDD